MDTKNLCLVFLGLFISKGSSFDGHLIKYTGQTKPIKKYNTMKKRRKNKKRRITKNIIKIPFTFIDKEQILDGLSTFADTVADVFIYIFL